MKNGIKYDGVCVCCGEYVAEGSIICSCCSQKTNSNYTQKSNTAQKLFNLFKF